MRAIFKDRFDAARQLAERLKQYANNPDALVLAIPRGGLQLGNVLARELHLPLDVVFTKKIGYPGNPEYAIGAVSARHVFISPDFAHIPELHEYIMHQAESLRAILGQREVDYRKGMPSLDVTNKIVIVVDDGVATGNTLLATLALLKEDNPQKIVVALPVASKSAFELLQKNVDELLCLYVPDIFYGVGQFYDNFDQVDDAQAIHLLHEANR